MSDVPDTIRVGPHRYTIEQERGGEATDNNLKGATYADHCRIVLAAQMADSIRREVVLHETLHAVWHGTGLGSHDADDHAEHIIDSLAPVLLQVLADNPHLVAYLVEVSGE